MCQKVYFSKRTSFVFISAKDETTCDTKAKRYFKSKHIRKYIESSKAMVQFADNLKKVKIR